MKNDYRLLILTLIFNGIAAPANLIIFALNTNRYRWISLELGIACSIALVFVLTHRENYIRRK